MNDTLNNGGISPNVQEEALSKDKEMETDVEGVRLDGEESLVDTQESLTAPVEETTSPSGFGVSDPPPPVSKVAEITAAGSLEEGSALETSASLPKDKNGILDALSDVFDMEEREIFAQEAQQDICGPDGLTTTDNLLLVGIMFLALIFGGICSSIFSRFFRWHI